MVQKTEFFGKKRKGTEIKNLIEFWEIEQVEACSSVDLESVFPTHGVVGSSPTKPNKFLVFYGERGIRTLGMGLPYDALAMRYLRPLGHLPFTFFTLQQRFYRKK